MSCTTQSSYWQQKEFYKDAKKRKYKLFKHRFINTWLKYGKTKTINGVKVFDRYRIDCDGEGQAAMARALRSPTLPKETCDKHFDKVELYFEFNALSQISDNTIDAFFADYKKKIAAYNPTKIYYRLGYEDVYWGDVIAAQHKVVFDAYFLSATGKIESDFMDKVAFEIATHALTTAAWVDPQNPFIAYQEVILDAPIDDIWISAQLDGIRALIQIDESGAVFGQEHFIAEIEAFAVETALGQNILDDLTSSGILINGVEYGGAHYLSIAAARKMRDDVFFNLISKSLAFDTDVKDKYKWRKVLLAFVVVVIAALTAYFVGPGAAMSVFTTYLSSQTQSAQAKAALSIFSFAAGGGFSGAIGGGEALNLVMNVAQLYYAMQLPPLTPPVEDQKTDRLIWQYKPYSIYDEMHCYAPLISVQSGA